MKAQANHALAILLTTLCWAVVSGTAHGDSSTALQHAALRKACAEQGGRFELSWTYNDQGLQWGKVLSCSTTVGYITCQGNFCRSGRWVLRDDVLAAENGQTKNGPATRFPPEPAAFSKALAALSDK